MKEVGTGFADRSVARPAEGKEFDPLSTQRSISHEDNAQTKVMSSFGISGEGQCICPPPPHCFWPGLSTVVVLLLFVGCSMSQQQSSVSQGQIKLSTSPSHNILTPGRPVPVLTL